jgi:RNA polymerase sigma-70 factor (ECF subfamily)
VSLVWVTTVGGTVLQPDETKTHSFTEFVSIVEGKLRHALTAAHGVEDGREAVAEALAYGWEHWDHIQGMDNPVGYLYRVGHNHARKVRTRRRVSLPAAPLEKVPWVEPGLPDALSRLSEKQRVAVYLVFGQEWSTSEVAALLGVSKTTVQKHVERGMEKLRRRLGVEV